MTAAEMQQTVIAEYAKFYSRVRVAGAFLTGLFARHRRLGDGLQAYLRSLPRARRVPEWLRLQLQFKFAPWAVLRIGRQRVLEYLRHSEYLESLEKPAETVAEQREVEAVLEASLAFQKAEISLKRNDMVQAEELARRARTLDPKQADYLAMLAWLEATRPGTASTAEAAAPSRLLLP